MSPVQLYVFIDGCVLIDTVPSRNYIEILAQTVIVNNNGTVKVPPGLKKGLKPAAFITKERDREKE